jgi:hypothetical protein
MMLSPGEAIEFEKIVMTCYDNVEFRKNWERLRKAQLNNHKAYKSFIGDIRNIVWDRLPRDGGE